MIMSDGDVKCKVDKKVVGGVCHQQQCHQVLHRRRQVTEHRFKLPRPGNLDIALVVDGEGVGPSLDLPRHSARDPSKVQGEEPLSPRDLKHRVLGRQYTFESFRQADLATNLSASPLPPPCLSLPLSVSLSLLLSPCTPV